MVIMVCLLLAFYTCGKFNLTAENDSINTMLKHIFIHRMHKPYS